MRRYPEDQQLLDYAHKASEIYPCLFDSGYYGVRGDFTPLV